MTTSLTLVVPAYNEAEALRIFLPQLLEHCATYERRVIIVNDGSADGTARILSEASDHTSLTVITHKLNRGYGAALKTGLAAATTDYVISVDADGQHRLDDVERLMACLLETDADLVVGKRNTQASLYRSIGKWGIRRITKMLMTVPIEDINSGMKLYRTALVQRYLPLCPSSMAFSDIIGLVFISERRKVVECPITVEDRTSGVSSITTRTAFETVLEILHIIMLFNPMRVFVPIAIVCVLAGIVWGTPIVFLQRGISIGAMLAIVTGLFSFGLGLLAEQLSLLRKSAIENSFQEIVPKSVDLDG